MEKSLLLDKPGPVAAPGAEGHRRYQGKEGLAGGQGTFIGEVQELLATERSKGRPGVVPLSQPFALGRGLRGHAYHHGQIGRYGIS